MYNSTNGIVGYLYLLKLLQITRINMYFYEGKVSLIGRASVTIILCLHVSIAHRIFINCGYVDYFQ